MIPNIWETQRLRVRNFEAKDADVLQDCLKALYEKTNWQIISQEPYQPDYFDRVQKTPDLPPGFHKLGYQVQTIFEKNTDIPLGWCEFLEGYPDGDVFWISTLIFHPEACHKGFGSEAVHYLTGRIKSLDRYSAVHLAVYARNFSGLTFWHKHQFSRIVRISGDKEFGEAKACKIVLERRF